MFPGLLEILKVSEPQPAPGRFAPPAAPGRAQGPGEFAGFLTRPENAEKAASGTEHERAPAPENENQEPDDFAGLLEQPENEQNAPPETEYGLAPAPEYENEEPKDFAGLLKQPENAEKAAPETEHGLALAPAPELLKAAGFEAGPRGSKDFGPRPAIAPSAGGDEDAAAAPGPGLPARGPLPPASELPRVWGEAVPEAAGFEAGPRGSKDFGPRPAIAPSAGGDEDAARPGPREAADILRAALNNKAAETGPSEPRLPATLSESGGPWPHWPGLTSSLLARNRLNPASPLPGPQVWGRGEAGRPAEVFAALEQARTDWPAPFRKQVGLGLVALGRPGLSANSMAAGAALLGSATPGEVLKSVLEGLKGELGVLKLPAGARDSLGRLLAKSGLNEESVNRITAAFGKDGLSLAELDKKLTDLSGRASAAGGLKATEAGLVELGRFLGSLGASVEMINQVMNSLSPGQPVTGETLRDLLQNIEAGGLARTLGPGDLSSLSAFLREMGATPADMGRLGHLLGETHGQLTLGGFLDFLDSLKEAPVGAVTQEDLAELRSLLDQVSRDEGLSKTPVFNETLIKLRVLGEAESDDDFMKMPPALQALRGGLSGSEDFIGQQFRGQRENQERQRQFFQAAATGQDGPAASMTVAAQAAEGYAGGPETLSRQIAQKILYSRRRGLHRLKMNLNPAELGRLDIELAVRGGTLTARIKAESREAYEALGGKIRELKEALAASGVELVELTLAHDDAESGRTLTAGLAELTKAREEGRAERREDYPGEVSRII